MVQTAGSWLRGSVKQWTVVSLMFSLLVCGTMIYAYPIYYEFDAPGEMIPLSDIGIDSSVHFVTVYSGVTDSWIDRYATEWGLDDEEAKFYRVDPYYADYVTDWEGQSEYRESAILHAFDAVIGEEAEDDERADEHAQKLDEILMNTINFYGDSMGLMVAIGLHEELHELDFSAAGRYVIAGTGTMEADSSVGSIAALEQKLILADREQVTHFFVPKDEEWYGEESNEAEARKIARQRDLMIQIIPVAKLEDALHYLYELSGLPLPEEVQL